MPPHDETNRRILVIDEDPERHEDLRRMLDPESVPPASDERPTFRIGGTNPRATSTPLTYEVASAFDGAAGCDAIRGAIAKGHPYAMVIVDMDTPPNGGGVRTVEEIRRIDPEMQIVLHTTIANDALRDAIDRLGETDGLFALKRPVDVLNVRQLACIMTHKWTLTRQARMQASDLDRLVESRTRDLHETNRRLVTEIGHRERVQDQLLHAALHDALTGLPNRALLLERLGRCLERAQRQAEYTFAVLFIDLDDFKDVNDTFGHRAGDELLIAIAHRLGACVRSLEDTARPQDDTTARLGGDEFVILLDGIRRAEDAQIVAERIQAALEEPFTIAGRELRVTVSIGVTTSMLGYENPDEVLRDADAALYEAKSVGKSRFVQFGATMRDQATARMQIEEDLRTAIDRNELELRFHPIVCLHSGRIDSIEALLRWQHPQHGTMAPGDFLSIAEETGQIIPIGEWVFREACHHARAWRTRQPHYKDLSLSVNISAQQLACPDFRPMVLRTLGETALPPSSLNLEITENVTVDNADVCINALVQLREDGLGIHLDDFGTGRSSLSHLRQLPIDVLKIDRDCIRDLGTNREFSSTVNAIINLAHNHEIQVIAEGIENAEQLVQLQALDCDFGQGYFFAKPCRADTTEAMLASGIRWARAG